MKMRHYLIITIALVFVGIAACGDDSSTTQEQSTAVQSTPAAEPTSAPTVVPTAMPAAVPTAVPTPVPTAAPTATPPPSPTATAVPESASMVGSGIKLSEDCLPGGVIDTVATILSCGMQAIQQVESFSFDVFFDLSALDGAGPGEESMRISGAIGVPDKLQLTVLMVADGEKTEINGVMVGQDSYIHFPVSGQWFKEVLPDADSQGPIHMIRTLQIPNDPNAILNENVDLDDGTKGYVIVSDQTGPGSGVAGLGLPESNLTWIVGVDDFLTREVRVSVEGMSGKPLDAMSMSYSGYNEPVKIEPPAEYEPIPEELIQSGPPGAATVVGLIRNDQGDVEVMFDKPVQVQGTVELYVLDPKTGGRGLPLLGGSGTDTFTFDADAEGRPALIVGKSQIAGFAFPDEESRLTDADGTGVNLNFDLWTYE